MSAAGFIATSTSGASPGVRMSWSAKCSWKLRDARQRARRARGSRPGSSGSVDRSLPKAAVSGGEPVAGQLHAVAGVAGEPDDDAVELVDLLAAHAGDVTRLSLRSTVDPAMAFLTYSMVSAGADTACPTSA